MWGLATFDGNGNPVDVNLNAALIVEGVFLLGSSTAGSIAIDQLFPQRQQFKGIFMMPVFHGLAGNPQTEQAVSIFAENGRLRWSAPNSVSTGGLWPSEMFRSGSFAGVKYIYGYFN